MSEDDEEFQVLRRRTPSSRTVADGVVGVLGSSLVTVAGVALFILAVVLGWPVEAQLGSLAIGFLAFLVGFRRFFAAAYPQIEAAEPRPRFPDEPEQVPDVMPVARRTLLARVLLSAAGALGLAALVPFASLGPRSRPPSTGWADGVRLVTEEGEAIRPDELGPGGVATVWPEDAVRDEHGTVLLVRLVDDAEPPTELDWVVDRSIVAYSRVCTHAGCAIAIFRESDSALYCPCHQAQFDLRRGAAPFFGPARRPLPQLPLGVDPDGYLVALGDFTEPVGPPRG